MIRLSSSVVAACVVCVVACGGRSKVERPARTQGTAVSELRYRLAVNPNDHAARRQLGMNYAKAGSKGAALRELLRVHKVGRLERPSRQVLAGLLEQRAKARLASASLGALGDLRQLRKLAPKRAIPLSLRVQAHALRALALLNHTVPDRRREGRGLVNELMALAPQHPLAALGDARRDTKTLARAVRWLAKRGALRLVLRVGKQYWGRGGRDPQVVAEWLRAHNWWHGTNDRPSVLVTDAMARQGLRVCDIARTPDEFGCGLELDAIAASATRATSLLRRSRQLSWSTGEPRQAAGWTVIALRAWLFGQADGWLSELASRVDIKAVASRADEVPAYARATILRAAGQPKLAGVALSRALALPGLSAEQRAVVMVEAAIQGRATDAKRLAVADHSGQLEWRAALVTARVLDNENQLLARAPAADAAAYLTATGRVGAAWKRHTPAGRRRAHARYARWWHSLSAAAQVRTATMAAWPAVPAPQLRVPGLGSADLLAHGHTAQFVGAGTGAALSRIAAAYASDPAVADRLAGEYADRGVDLGSRATALAALFRGLGDVKRANAWLALLTRANPDDWRASMAAGVSAAEAGELRVAQLRFVAAAAWSGDPGRVRLHGARVFARVGKYVEALGEARAALRHTAVGEQQPVFRLIVEASLRRGRVADAARTAAHWVARMPKAFRAATRQQLVTRWPALRDRLPGPRRAPWAPGRSADPSDVASALVAGTRARLALARAWNPHDVRAAAALLSLLPSRRRAPAVGELLAAVMYRWERGGTVSTATVSQLIVGLQQVRATAVAELVRAETRRLAKLR